MYILQPICYPSTVVVPWVLCLWLHLLAQGSCLMSCRALTALVCAEQPDIYSDYITWVHLL